MMRIIDDDDKSLSQVVACHFVVVSTVFAWTVRAYFSAFSVFKMLLISLL